MIVVTTKSKWEGRCSEQLSSESPGGLFLLRRSNTQLEVSGTPEAYAPHALYYQKMPQYGPK